MVFNFPLAVVETILPIINDFQPTVDILPKEKNDVFFADMMQKRFQQIVEESDLYGKILQAVKDSLIYSNGFLQILPVISDAGAFSGFDIQVIDPFSVIPHPYANDLDLQAGEYFLFAVPMEISKIEREYGIKCSADGRLDDYKAFQRQMTADYKVITHRPVMQMLHWLLSVTTMKKIKKSIHTVGIQL